MIFTSGGFEDGPKDFFDVAAFLPMAGLLEGGAEVLVS